MSSKGSAGNTSFFASVGASGTPGRAEPWLVTPPQTMLATRVMERESDEPTAATREIGRHVGNGEYELFVSCAPDEALLQQLEVVKPEFVALHDLGCHISRRLLAGVAGASQRRLQRLVIRRQGQGTPLATLEFLEWGHPGSRSIRLYTTEVDADTQARHAIAQVLLAHARLGAVFVGDLPAHALATSLEPLARAMAGSGWRNRQLLMLPIASATALSSQAAQLEAAQRRVVVRTTPRVSRPAEAWSFLSATWNQLREQGGAATAGLPRLAGVTQAAAAPTPRAADLGAAPAVGASSLPAAAPLPAVDRLRGGPEGGAASVAGVDSLRAKPEAGASVAGVDPLRLRPDAAAAPDPQRAARADASAAFAPPAGFAPSAAATPFPSLPGGDDPLEAYLERATKIAGLRMCCLVDTVSHRVLAQRGDGFEADALRRQAEVLLDAAAQAARALGLTATRADMALTFAAHHLVLRSPVPAPQRVLVALLDKAGSNLTLARLQIERLDELLLPAGTRPAA